MYELQITKTGERKQLNFNSRHLYVRQVSDINYDEIWVNSKQLYL